MSILIDASHLFFRNFWMNKDDIIEYSPNENGESVPTGVVNTGYMAHVIYSSILNLTRKFKAAKDNKVVIALDSKPSWRHDWYIKNKTKFPEYNEQTYKGNRKKHDELPFDEIWKSFNIAMEALNNYTDFQILKVDKAEADDIIAVLAMNTNDEDVYVCSSDKDFHQLQRENVHIYDPIKKIIIPKIDVQRHKQLHFLLAGDDNIKAVKPRCGIKTAEKMLAAGLDDILKTDPGIRERYEFNKVLIDFECIPDKISSMILEAEKEEYLNYNAMELMKFCSKYKMKKMVERIQQFNVSKNKSEKVISQNLVSAQVDTSISDFFS